MPVPSSHAGDAGHLPTGSSLRLARGAVVVARTGGALVVRVAGSSTQVDPAVAAGWARRVAPVLAMGALLPTDDLTPVETRTPWLRGEDGIVLALRRTSRGAQAEWALLDWEGGEAQIAAEEAGQLLDWLAGSVEASHARDVG